MRLFFQVILSPLSFLRFVLLFIVSFVILIILFVEYFLTRKNGSYRFFTSRLWGHIILFILGIQVKKNMVPKLDKFLMMPNHRSYIDIFIMAAYVPATFVAKAELRRWPIIGQAMKAFYIIAVKRSDLRSMIGTMNKIKQRVNEGIPVTVFPEGTTFEGPGTKDFKQGTFKIAAEAGIPIIPCAISYSDKRDAWIDDDLFVWHFFRQFWKPITKVDVRFGKVIIDDDYKSLKEKTQKSINSMLIKSESN
ncbi:MAG: lysophospholipid acyltransferase family protein [Prolixibacteraceae bacterium]|jgi:1-acyl-sn-glycerol-3-phosphate acyltransferase|nr:lysophospholipid acyltransferase family protein [Prolixibacteraceae bacterium]